MGKATGVTVGNDPEQALIRKGKSRIIENLTHI